MIKPDIKNYKGILFDHDGTLVDSLGIWFDADVAAIKSFGVDVDVEEFRAAKDEFWGNSSGYKNAHIAYCDFIINKFKLDINSVDFNKLQFAIGFESMRKLDYKANAGKFLSKLKGEGFKMGLVTTSNRQMIDVFANENEVLKKTADLNEIFGKNIITGDMVKAKKPDPEAYLAALDRIELRPNQCLAFEDSLIGVQAALAARIDTCVVYDPNSNKDRPKINALTPFAIENYNELII